MAIAFILYPLQQAFRFIAFRFRQQFFIRLREQRLYVHELTYLRVLRQRVRHVDMHKVFPEIKPDFPAFPFHAPGWTRWRHFCFHPPSGIVHTVSLQRQRAARCPVPAQVKSPFRHPEQLVLHDPAHGPAVVLRADVSEKYYGYLHSIQSANFKTPYDNKVYELGELKGRLLSYGKASGGTSFYVPVTFEFDNRGDVIPGSYVEVYLLSSEMPDVLALPVTALTEEQGLYFVYLQLDEEGYKKQEVTLGASNGKKVQILTGLKAGDRVVTKGAYQVKLASASNAIPAHSHEH